VSETLIPPFPSETIDDAALVRLPRLRRPLRPDWHLDPPDGLLLRGLHEPPGHPAYWCQTLRDEHFRKRGTVLVGAQGALRFLLTASHLAEAWAAYRPLPLEHPRVAAWIFAVLHYYGRCYVDPENDGLVTYPTPFSLRKDNAQADHHQQTRSAQVATVDHHMGVRRIRQTYPDWTPPHPLLLNGVPHYWPAHWWTIDAERPSPETCRGVPDLAHTDALFLHPCSWCGRWADPPADFHLD
jgi:hypothetical protein